MSFSRGKAISPVIAILLLIDVTVAASYQTIFRDQTVPRFSCRFLRR